MESTPTSVEIDGSLGEGGGQMLRSSLSLSNILGIPFSMDRIRARRQKTGLRPQHLTAVEASARLCGGHVEGAEVGASRIHYSPNHLPFGEHFIDIGTAGATSLLLHALYYPMAWSDQGGVLRLAGGTHVDKAPTFDYLNNVWTPMIRVCGMDVSLRLHRHGFYPRGGGLIEATIPSKQRPQSFRYEQRPDLDRISILALFGQPPEQKRPSNGLTPVAQRMGNAAQELLHQLGFRASFLCSEPDALCVGAVCHVICHFGPLRAGFTAWGWKGRPAEQVGAEAAALAAQFLRSEAVVDEWMADQLLLPLALAQGPSVFLAPQRTGHLLTNADIIMSFLPHVSISIESDTRGLQRVEIRP